ncbi:YHYH protein [Simiduia agarivorans]|uniref:YHYH domain-containing protein n=1 Tax=Simiduia agarivorans (strain DSM 21679 / JCM 13881 / BCRC 17597 / SA1) TaxID=1117647 RepID=K4KM12_SIMAS|nr:YHYH protein [Simiduia agarivorans]AFU99255.1 hypothetical protein M5M_10370 [Simiduia agarivorans SA1 = DSM 21679]
MQSLCFSRRLSACCAIALLSACGGSSDSDNLTPIVEDTDASTSACTHAVTELSGAYLFFGSNVTVTLSDDGCEVTFEAAGKPDHTSPYWNPDNRSGLYEAPGAETDIAHMSPGYIEDYSNRYYLTTPVAPEKAGSSTATRLGAVGIATSGAPIFNDQEGPNVALQLGVIQGFDRNGAHTGPEVYHYHLEPKAISDDDDALVGVMADGFFLYGRKCYGVGDYPTDLDESGGHTTFTQHTFGDNQYHYHIQNTLYLNAYYLAFPGDYQGTYYGISN